MALQAILDARGPQERIALFVKSDGGSGMAALRLVHLLRRYAKRLTVIAPLNCASAATMLALGADTIQMGSLSYLTAVDTSLEHDLSPLDHTNQLVPVSNDEVDRVIRLWKDTVGRRGDGVNPYQELYKYVHPLVIGALDRASSLSLMLCREILGYHMKDARKADRIARRLNSSYPAHQYPITSREARRLGLKVQEMPAGARPAAAAAEPALLGDGPARDHRLRRGEPPRQRDHEHPRGPRACRSSTRSRRTGTTARKSGAGWR